MTKAPSRHGYRGYCTSHEFGGFRIPIPVQNLVLRDYAARRRLFFKLSINELGFPECYLHLHSLLGELGSLEGIIMCSYFILPRRPEQRRYIYERVLAESAELHFVLENTVVRTHEDITRLEELFHIVRLLPECSDTASRNDLLLLGADRPNWFSLHERAAA